MALERWQFSDNFSITFVGQCRSIVTAGNPTGGVAEPGAAADDYWMLDGPPTIRPWQLIPP
jgi:hypothetical protein